MLALSTPMLVVSFVPAATSSLIRDVQEVTSAIVFIVFGSIVSRPVPGDKAKPRHDRNGMCGERPTKTAMSTARLFARP